MRVTLVHNPGAGDESHSAKRILKRLTDAGHDATLGSTGKRGISKALEDPGDLVVAAGGDGTIKKVALALAGRGIPLAILPIGTANNIAKSLGIIGSVDELIASWRSGNRRRLAVGTVATSYGIMRFVESVGVGAFTELVTRGGEEADENTASLTGHTIDRALLLLQRIVEERVPSSRRVEIDGVDLSGEYLLVEAMNTRLVGPNVPLAPGADYGDDQLDVVTVTQAERRVLTEYLEARLAGGADPPLLTVRRGKRVTLRASPHELHVDDEPWDTDLAEAGGLRRGPPGEADLSIAVGGTAVEVLT